MSKPRVAVIMGSNSDLEIAKEAAGSLEELGIPFEMKIMSAHRTPDALAGYAKSARSRGLQVIIAIAGHAAHLAGAIAANTTLPVLGVPVASSDLSGLDALLATVQMPSGVPVATLALGKSGAKNAAILAAQILALADKDIAGRLDALKAKMKEGVEDANKQLGE
jgi:phosphoribosylaminoimidazole carboxylase PurE protein